MPAWEENIGGLRAAVRAGTIVSILLTAGAAAYFLLTLDRPHRTELLIVDAAVAAVACAVRLVPLEALARRGLISAFFFAWSASLIVLASAAVVVDDDPASPLAGAFFLPLIFAAIAYPLRLAGAVALIDVTAAVVTLGPGVGRDGADVMFFAVVLVCGALLCLFQAREHERHLADVARLSRTDYLTDTLNRRGFDEELRERLARFHRYRTSVGLVLLDLDGFKAINDARGHAAGDALLRTVADAVRETVRGTDAVARVGGDEFAVLLEQSNGVTAPVVAERVRVAIAGHSPASAGWATCPGDAEDGDDLYRRADARLYERKGARVAAR